MRLAPSQSVLRDADPRGRVDILLYRLTEMFCRKAVEPACGNLKVWDSGIGEIVETALAESSLPREPLTAVDLARRVGLLKQNRQRRRGAG